MRTTTGLVVGTVAIVTILARAAEPEDCLRCHRYRGLARMGDDEETVHLFHVDPDYAEHALGLHARLPCTACHDHDAVGVIPHRAIGQMDCTRSCHLPESTDVEARFSHKAIADMLGMSVHTPDVLDACNRWLGYPLEPGQSRCLLCHDEPLFSPARHSDRGTNAPVRRCLSCHEEHLPMDARHAYWHVHGREPPAHTHEATARLCAWCHSHPTIREHYGLRDTTASYLASFHGKAMLLGSERTAGCLDCHVHPFQNTHVMLSTSHSDSPAHWDRRADACRRCHPGAGERVTAAAVHLELDPRLAANRLRVDAQSAPSDDIAFGSGIEYLIAICFVVLIVVTIGPAVLLQSLQLVQVVVRRQDPDYPRRLRLARSLLSDPTARRSLERFTSQQCLQHWALVACFAILAVTGFPLTFADRAWAAWLVAQVGGLGVARNIHRGAGVLLLAGFAYHVAYVAWHVWRQKSETGQGRLRTIGDLPMVLRKGDWKRLLHLLAYLLFLQKTRPAAGRFTLREKFDYVGVL